MRRHLSYANVVSTLALCLVVGGGGAYAATQLAPNSVKSKHIATGAVASSDIKNRSVRLQDLAADVTGKNGTTGLKGDPGPQGSPGLQGPPGSDGAPGAPGQNLDFNGVRMGPLTLYQPSASTVLELGAIGTAMDVTGRCYMDADVIKYSIAIRRDAGTTGIVYLFGGTNPNGWSTIGPGSSAALFFYSAGLNAQQWSATVAELETGATYDVRGIATRDPTADTCRITDASIERVSR